MFQDCNQQDGKIRGLKAEILKEIMAEEIAQGFQDNSEFSGEQEKPPQNMEQLQYNEEQTMSRPHFKEEVAYKEKQLDKDYLKQKPK